MIKIFLGLIVSSFLFAGDLANKKEFMKMCENPTPSQKITFEALAKDNRVKNDEQMCAYLYARTGSKYFSADADIYTVTDLSPLKFFLSLTFLSLPRSKVKNISILKHLTKLKELDLYDNPVRDLTPLKDLKYLEELDLSKTKVTDLSPLNNIKTLQQLSYGYIENIETVDISQIKDLKNLEFLVLRGIKVKNFHLINNFENLMVFFPPKTTTIQDMSLLTNLKKLKRLDLDDAKLITNLDFILNFPNMQELFLENTSIKDISILKKLSNLTILNISNTKVTDASGIMANTAVNPMYLVFRARNTPLRWCSPKNTQDIRNGKSCFEKDGTLKPFYKRWLGL
ncbi:leucine-rich repeat domain-containing protein [Sulfurimonas lithotrophica]|uniref:Leucine-rich repeat domain-containing protein n=1 Tax=Sulfurimonas lithotrophica TaxID=2590022 RepID=A0A5P8P432_9BACT|nr:leucine-rich repeat domain-containing protein [Sulfurimonas lithotrophica]QFR50371.1 leucine-rich repeat domain-containing protein [Sulfurimonas lithotrophica]